LCGEDSVTHQSFEHRRQWLVDRIHFLASVFAIDVCAYAVMSNHYHLVVKLDPEKACHWSDEEVLRRWTSLFKGTLLVQRHMAKAHLSLAEQDTLRSTMLIYRQRLTSLSWFMKCLNEPIARQANAEDGCSGHFWEARFHSQALLTERALLCAMAYVDLNPVRAGIAKNPEDSKYTSYRARMTAIDNQELKQAIAEAVKSRELHRFKWPLRALLPFADEKSKFDRDCLPMTADDYRELVVMTAAATQNPTRSRKLKAPAILNRLDLSESQWITSSLAFRHHYHSGDLNLKKIA
jgi:REP element-mobilizing transposase RayT